MMKLGVGALASAALLVGLVATPAYAALTVSSYLPNPVAASTGGNTCQVLINGTDFVGVTGVTFNGPPIVASPSFTADSATQITATVPTTAATGTVTVFTTAVPAGMTGAALTITGSGGCPVISSFAPTSGVVGTSVTVTGSNLTGVSLVRFGSVTTVPSNVPTATSFTVTVPAGATTGPIRAQNSAGWGSSATSYTVTLAPAPTIASFTPTSGLVGKTVTITGTNFSGTGFTTSSVKFNGTTATFTVNSATQITATVPTGATTGKITVTTPGGTATSTTDFTVSTLHARSVSLELHKHLVASGHVTVSDSFSACADTVPVKIQRRKAGGGWHTVKNTTTSSSGAYHARLNDVAGRYRARAPRMVLNSGADICQGAVSSTRRHR